MAEKSKLYKNVYLNTSRPQGRIRIRWHACLCMPDKKRWNAYFETEREAAIAVDKKLIEMGKSPVNILKKK